MRWDDVPQEYKDLEKNFNYKCLVIQYLEDISGRFLWSRTPQGANFWLEVCLAKEVSELPLITIKDYTE